MIDFLFSAVAFIVALGALITIHEFGHFWVARKAGVKVLRFSVGFGKPLFKKIGKKDNTEFVVAAIPLGGYVKMLDEREGPVAPAERHRSFNNQSVWARIAIVAAGPIANFLLAIVAYWAMFIIGISGVVPLIGGVEENSAASRAGFQIEDKIIAVQGKQTRTWNQVRLAVLDASLDASGLMEVTVEDKDGTTRIRTLAVDSEGILKGKGDVIGDLGLQHWWPQVEPIIGGVSEDGAAKRAGLQAGDRVLTVNNQALQTWRDWVNIVRENPARPMELVIERDGIQMPLTVTPDERSHASGTIGYIGAWEGQSRLLLEKVRTVVRFSPIDAVTAALERTKDMSVLTVQMLWKLIVGQASIENISGPITIAQFAGQSASVGIDHYLGFLALISISLGVLNLLPVPMLDGGHLLYFFIEVIRGKPVSEKVQLFGQQIGMVLLAGLMSIAFYNDILRLIG